MTYLKARVRPCSKDEVALLYIVRIECNIDLARGFEHASRFPSYVALVIDDGAILGEIRKLVLHAEKNRIKLNEGVYNMGIVTDKMIGWVVLSLQEIYIDR